MIEFRAYQGKISNPAEPAIDGVAYETKPSVQYVGGEHVFHARPVGTGPVITFLAQPVGGTDPGTPGDLIFFSLAGYTYPTYGSLSLSLQMTIGFLWDSGTNSIHRFTDPATGQPVVYPCITSKISTYLAETGFSIQSNSGLWQSAYDPKSCWSGSYGDTLEIINGILPSLNPSIYTAFYDATGVESVFYSTENGVVTLPGCCIRKLQGKLQTDVLCSLQMPKAYSYGYNSNWSGSFKWRPAPHNPANKVIAPGIGELVGWTDVIDDLMSMDDYEGIQRYIAPFVNVRNFYSPLPGCVSDKTFCNWFCWEGWGHPYTFTEIDGYHYYSIDQTVNPTEYVPFSAGARCRYFADGGAKTSNILNQESRFGDAVLANAITNLRNYYMVNRTPYGKNTTEPNSMTRDWLPYQIKSYVYEKAV